jgi:hypothetical protein
MRNRIHAEIAAMKARELSVDAADHLMVEAVRRDVLPASNLPRVIEALGETGARGVRSSDRLVALQRLH